MKKRDPPVDNKLIIVLIIVGIFAVLIGISFISNNTQEERERAIQEKKFQTTTTVITRPLTCEEGCNNDITCINNCKLAEVNKITAKKDATFKDCETIKDKISRERCITNIAFKESSLNLDDSYCNFIEDPIKKENCKNNVIIDKAYRTKDKSICDQLLDINLKEACKKTIK